jgi:hypothetical protein
VLILALAGEYGVTGLLFKHDGASNAHHVEAN